MRNRKRIQACMVAVCMSMGLLTGAAPIDESVDKEETEAISEDATEALLQTEAATDSAQVQSSIEKITIQNGQSIQNIFFAGRDACLIVEIYDAKVVSQMQKFYGNLVVTAGENTQTIPVAGGKAVIELSDSMNGNMEMVYEDAQGVQTEVTKVRVVMDEEIPDITYTSEQTETGELVHVTIRDAGSELSGIDEYTCTMDASSVEVQNEEKKRQVLADSECEVVTTVTFDVEIADQDMHTLNIDAVDNAGNTNACQEEVQWKSNAVMSVVLPTSFSMKIDPYGIENETETISSSDIVICNQSDFPVNAVLTSVSVELSDDVAANLQLHILAANQEEQLLPLSNGENSQVAEIALAQRQESTNANELVQDTSRKTQVDSADYIVLRIGGNVDAASASQWTEDKLKVSMVFSFDQ